MLMNRYYLRIIVPLLSGLLCSLVALAQEPKPTIPDSIDKDYSAELPRIAPLSPAEALKSFEIAPGFKLELVAAEPLVADPIAICFDENSRMYVVEMRGYSENRDEKISRITLLEDTNDDGRFDKSTIFADQLFWPTAIHCWKGGVFVADAPDLLYLKDTTGDGVADEKKVVLTGFGTSNVQGLVNTFQWSLDNRIVAAISSSGAELRKPDDTKSKPFSLRGRDLAFDPNTMELTAVTGGAQHGATTDIWGNRFVCSNSDHIQHCVIEDHYLARNPYLAVAGARRSIAADGPQADVFRISPLEPWRIVRTRLRVNKIVPGIVEGGGRPSGYFTSATGVTIYTGDAWPAEFLGLAFVGDVGSNIVHRKRLKPNGVSFTAERIDEKTEFIASRDTWFRPVQFANAPDGCLYICDMYRETIEHPLSIPPILKKHLDLTSGRDRGRIYRVVHEKFTQRKLPKLAKARIAELVKLLDHANGWHRETAARLIYERRDPAGVVLLEALSDTASPQGKIEAIYALAGLKALTDEVILARLSDDDAHVRQHALRAGEMLVANSPAIAKHLISMTGDADHLVRYQLAFALANLPHEERVPALLTLLKSDIASADVRNAVLSSLSDGSGLMIKQLAADTNLIKREGASQFVQSLFAQIGKQQRNRDLDPAVETINKWLSDKSPLGPLALESLAVPRESKLGKALNVVTAGRADELLDKRAIAAQKVAINAEAKLSERVSAIKQMRSAKLAAVIEAAESLLSPMQPVELQGAIIDIMQTFDSPEVAALLLARFSELTPAIRGRALDALISRAGWSLQSLDAVDQKILSPSDIDSVRLKLLTESSHAQVRERSLALAKANRPSDRNEVLGAYRSVLETTGDAARGKEVFKKNCAACHKLQGVGHELGPNLAAMKNRGAEAILVNVLDPNREVNPQFLNYLVLTTDGRSLSGVLTAETATSITLRRQESATDTVLRVDIEQLKSTGQSLMPVGMEKQIDKNAMADLLEYLKTLE